MTRTNFTNFNIELQFSAQYFDLYAKRSHFHRVFLFIQIYFSHHKFYGVWKCLKKKRQSRFLFILCPNLSQENIHIFTMFFFRVSFNLKMINVNRRLQKTAFLLLKMMVRLRPKSHNHQFCIVNKMRNVCMFWRRSESKR